MCVWVGCGPLYLHLRGPNMTTKQGTHVVRTVFPDVDRFLLGVACLLYQVLKSSPDSRHQSVRLTSLPLDRSTWASRLNTLCHSLGHPHAGSLGPRNPTPVDRSRRGVFDLTRSDTLSPARGRYLGGTGDAGAERPLPRLGWTLRKL